MGLFSGISSFFKNNKDSISSGLALGSFGLGLLETVKGFKQQELINKQVADQNKLAREAFDWSKYSQENKYQISSLDAQKAGINPLAMTGVGMSSLSASSAISSPLPRGNDVSSGLSAYTALATSKAQNDTAKQIAKGNNETAKEVAKIQAGVSAYSSDTSYKANSDRIKAEQENLTRQQQHEILIQDKKFLQENYKMSREHEHQDSMQQKQFAQDNYEMRIAFDQALAEFEQSESKEERIFNFNRAKLVMELERFYREARTGKYDLPQFQTFVGKILQDSASAGYVLAKPVDSFINGLYGLFTGKDKGSLSSYLNANLPTYKRSEYAQWRDKE